MNARTLAIHRPIFDSALHAVNKTLEDAMIVKFKTPRTPSPPPAESPDDFLLGCIARWRVARCKAQLHWAEGDRLTKFGLVETEREGSPKTALDEMFEMESLLADFKPATALGARQLLGVAADILVAQVADPETHLASGPVLQIVQSAIEAISYLPYETAIGPAAHQQPRDNEPS